MYESIIQNKNKIAVIGLGYVGLPIAIEFGKKLNIIGYDINEERIKMLREQTDPNNELQKKDFEGSNVKFTTLFSDLQSANFFIVTVPTPIDDHKNPKLDMLILACKTIGKTLKKDDYVVFESTVYPSCTEELCVPILEAESGLKFKKDFKVGYSPERINPGDKEHYLTNVTKIVSGCDKEATKNIAKIYEIIIKAGVYIVSSIKIAEAAKIIENTQRDVNIALMNELSIVFNLMGINTYEVLEAAGTKWNFQKFYPGLVGGHCIGVDPYYLSFKAKQLGYHAQIIEAGRYLNDSMGAYVAQKTIKLLIKNNKNIYNSKILILGITFKENVSDIRNTKVIDIINEFRNYKINFYIYDPNVSASAVKKEYNLDIISSFKNNKYDAIVIAVNHKVFNDYDEKLFKDILTPDGIIIDIKGTFKNKIKENTYWSL